jgi:cytochrome c nitrite reductase small subunit
MRARLLYVAVGFVLGVAVGLGVYTFVYAKGYSYLTSNPRACANCHVMQDHYDAWQKSSHHAAATCNDCHTPHTLAAKYATKALNGFLHSFAFTRGNFPDVIQITARNSRVTEGTCRSCHAELTTSIVAAHNSKDISCIRCHFNAGHSAGWYSPRAAGSSPARTGELTHGIE